MNHGIADAASLVRKLKSALADHSSIENAISAYNAEMIEHADGEVATSKENTEMLHD
jgi:2-polyprenyl-6-methoxyphenol hydroxylase-like FAD-dependent oxidoreductase